MVCKYNNVIVTVYFISFNTLTNTLTILQISKIHIQNCYSLFAKKFRIAYSKIIHYFKIRKYHRLMEDAIVFGLKTVALDGK